MEQTLSVVNRRDSLGEASSDVEESHERWSSDEPLRTTALAAGLEAPVRVLEASAGRFDVPGPLPQRLRVPFAAWHAEEVSPVDVDGAGESLDGVGHGVDRFLPQREHFLLRQR